MTLIRFVVAFSSFSFIASASINYRPVTLTDAGAESVYTQLSGLVSPSCVAGGCQIVINAMSCMSLRIGSKPSCSFFVPAENGTSVGTTVYGEVAKNVLGAFLNAGVGHCQDVSCANRLQNVHCEKSSPVGRFSCDLISVETW